MADLFEDLRFFIGSFFFLVGGILVIHSQLNPSTVEGVDINFWAGFWFLVFSVGAFALVLMGWTERRRARALAPTPTVAKAGAR